MRYIPAKTIITKTKSNQWFGADYNMNIYRGCCHGCIYCDSRSDCYHVEDFDEVCAKENALEIIRNDLRRKVKTGVVGTGAMSDPYNPFESKLLLTRNALELINAYEFGSSITTKSDLILRDIDILSDIKEHSPVIIEITITCADDDLCQVIEPNAPVSSLRFEAVKKLSEAGIYCGVLMMPLLPFINDNKENIIKIVNKAKESGARFVYPSMGLTMRDSQRKYLYMQFDKDFPGMKERYIKKFGSRYNCSSPKARELYAVFKKECEAAGLIYNMQDIMKSYKMGYKGTQLSFL